MVLCESLVDCSGCEDEYAEMILRAKAPKKGCGRVQEIFGHLWQLDGLRGMELSPFLSLQKIPKPH
ncbi:hypothetical protein MUK42_17168 [Musa troglodytarum]|uniref:Uncharacterized protein n=1 Tax=Musa troglodytarum TaxID=320322 RepID=A0A9E7H6Y4_9LILI|nr:hypothetical protein MUK42_17168 [Musa troglodytarum]